MLRRYGSERLVDGLIEKSMLGHGREVVLKGLAHPIEVIAVRWAQEPRR